jgi:ABC-type polysaccharide/polyol phosphate transport system ATPase subunit
MTKLVATNLSLSYEVPGKGLGGMVMERLHSRRGAHAPRPKTIMALKDLNLTLRDGDRLALLGLNGAGKTTLLKVMAGIYEPTKGSLSVDGKVAPLFDVGLGMDGDMTGRQNLIARGLFLGLTRREIAALEQEIIDFTGLAAYIDYPVNTYSAGMYIRLAFAVVTALTPEILLMDEGIGVGDAEFREKAHLRMDAFLRRAGILVLSSHDFGLVREYCDQALVLHEGSPLFHGPVEDGINFLENFVQERHLTQIRATE